MKILGNLFVRLKMFCDYCEIIVIFLLIFLFGKWKMTNFVLILTHFNVTNYYTLI